MATSDSGSLDLRQPTADSPERFDPEADSWSLMHAEHLARYQWAAQLVEGREVLDAGCGTGYGSEVLLAEGASRLVAVDLAEEAVKETTRRLGNRASVRQANVRELPFDDTSFDVVVCFEVIEHVLERARALREFARVLRPDGVLVISSPNRDRYLPGNPHHVHEYTPSELKQELGTHFEHVTLVTQEAWLASVIDAVQRSDTIASELLIGDESHNAGMFVLAVASVRPHKLPAPRLVLADPFEVRWWSEQVEHEQRERAVLSAALSDETGRRGELEHELIILEQRRGRVEAERADAKAARDEARLEAEHSESVAEDLRQRLLRAEATIAGLTGSVSWRLTAPLRHLKGNSEWARRRRR